MLSELQDESIGPSTGGALVDMSQRQNERKHPHPKGLRTPICPPYEHAGVSDRLFGLEEQSKPVPDRLSLWERNPKPERGRRRPCRHELAPNRVKASLPKGLRTPICPPCEHSGDSPRLFGLEEQFKPGPDRPALVAAHPKTGKEPAPLTI